MKPPSLGYDFRGSFVRRSCPPFFAAQDRPALKTQSLLPLNQPLEQRKILVLGRGEPTTRKQRFPGPAGLSLQLALKALCDEFDEPCGQCSVSIGFKDIGEQLGRRDLAIVEEPLAVLQARCFE
jgi:hypothetical protein